MIERHKSSLGLGDYSGYTWDWDQKLLSRIILESGLCTVPRENKIWDLVRLSPPAKYFDDSKTCFHGIKVRTLFRVIINFFREMAIRQIRMVGVCINSFLLIKNSRHD